MFDSIAEQLVLRGYEVDFGKEIYKDDLDQSIKNVLEALINFQKDNNLYVGGFTMESLIELNIIKEDE